MPDQHLETFVSEAFKPRSLSGGRTRNLAQKQLSFNSSVCKTVR